MFCVRGTVGWRPDFQKVMMNGCKSVTGITHSQTDNQAGCAGSDPETSALADLNAWTKKKARELRNNLLERERIETYARKRLNANPDDDIGWALLQIVYFGKDQIEHFLDLLDSEEVMDKLSAFRQMGMMDP